MFFANVSFSSTTAEKDTSISSEILLTNELSEAPFFREADKTIEAFMQQWKLRGASVAIVKDGRLLYAKGFGYADKEKEIFATPINTFRIASVSKLITAIAIMKLVEEGKISVNDSVFGPDGILNDEKYSHFTDNRYLAITVDHLLRHEGGWNSRYGDHMFMPHYIARYMNKPLPITKETIIEFALKKGLHFMPGTASSYSNLGYVILGEIIEKISGMDYVDYVNKEILHPLGIWGMRMTSNKYKDKGPLEVKYYDSPNAKKRLSIYSNTQYAPKTYEGTDFETLGSAGGWTASAAELMKLLQGIDGYAVGKDMLSCSIIDSMTILDDPEKYAYGWIHSDNQGNWWRTGTLSGTSAFVMRRCDGISYAFITNTSTYRGSRFAYDIQEMMQQAITTITWWPEKDLFPYLINAENSFSAE